jgi:hypothetical protein
LRECERGERGAVSSPVPVDAGRTSALLLANGRSEISADERSALIYWVLFSPWR